MAHAVHNHAHADHVLIPSVRATGDDQPMSMPHDMSGHAMAFHFGFSETILFNFWRVESVLGIILSCILIIAICFLLEFVRWYRLYRKDQRFNGETDSLQDTSARPNFGKVVSDGVLHAIQLTLSYLLMLIFMSFNVWLCAAVVVGEVAARALFAFFFPKFDRLRDVLAATETCCG